MEVNDELVNNIAQLARLRFVDDEKEEIKMDLKKMIAFIEKLNELDTTGVEPLLHVSDNVNIFREDEVIGSVTSQKALANAPIHDEQFFKVPKVIKK
ncbi:MAG: Asp-tRNA(Asn)/Glu-tRNA(Gln) amidotransferase subunit GatC [Ginsengibacter sp.]